MASYTGNINFIASVTTLLARYTLGYPSSALLELSELPNEYAFTNETILPDLFGVSFKTTYIYIYVLNYMCCFFLQSFAPLGALFGSSIAGWTADGLGRKPALIISSLPNLNGWLLPRLFIPGTPRYLVSKGKNEEGYRVYNA